MLTSSRQLALVVLLLLPWQASALTLEINGMEITPYAYGGVSVLTQVTPNQIEAGLGDAAQTEASLGVIGSLGEQTRGRSNLFFFVELPSLGAKTVASADAWLSLVSRTDSPIYNLDLWGLGFVTAEDLFVDEEWRLFADSDAGAGLGVASRTRIQDDFLTPSTALPGVIDIDLASSLTLRGFLNSLYSAGAEAGDLAVFRLNPDAFIDPAQADAPQYRVGFDEVVVPEPQSAFLLGLGLLALARRGRLRA